MTTSQIIVRWLVFIPAGFIAAILASFPIHWFVMINFGGWGMEPLIEIRNTNTLRTIEYTLQALFGVLAFIYAAARTAPNHKKIISIILAIIIVLGINIYAFFSNSITHSSGNGMIIQQGIVQIIAQIIGAVIAIYLIHSHVQKESVKNMIARE
jgi:hypothetical protein